MNEQSAINKNVSNDISPLKQRNNAPEQSEKSPKNTDELLHLAAEILGVLNDPPCMTDTINFILTAIKRKTGFDAVGIRLKRGDDFPYFVQNGFPHDFLLAENTIITRDPNGGCCKDENGNISLECTCGLVISGKTDPKNPLFTEGGSCWTNNSPTLLDISADEDLRFRPRNNCVHQGYRSVALVPIRSHSRIVGLLQLNDRRNDCFTLEMIQFFEGIAGSIGVALMRKQAEEEREKLILDLQNALAEVKKLSGMLPICASCKKIRDDKGYWSQIESYIKEHADVEFSHGICPECAERLYPDIFNRLKKKNMLASEKDGTRQNREPSA
jgi:hypothetical protein